MTELTKHELEMRQQLLQAIPVGCADLRIIVRSTEDTDYPRAVERAGIGAWFRINFGAHYNGGLDLIQGVQHVAFKPGQRGWDIVPHGCETRFEALGYEITKTFGIGRIPLKNIVAVNGGGDEYYQEPHIWCKFSERDGSPYHVEFQREISGGRVFLPEDRIQVAD